MRPTCIGRYRPSATAARLHARPDAKRRTTIIMLNRDEAAACLAKRPGRATVQNLPYLNASHLPMGTGVAMTELQVPGTTFSIDYGGTAEGTITARAEAWAASKRFLAAL